MIYTPIIGLEIHIEPNTKSKMFCACPQDHFGKKPNSQTCPICLGLPGSLPFTNREAINKTIKLGLALGSKISEFSKFYRKHYFYPDLPKGFQTSQKDEVLCLGGSLFGKRINHIHLEEDAGKLMHVNNQSLVDFNRSGCALIELVTEPDFHSTDEVLAFTKELQLIARYLDISNADMEKGTMRLEANISMLNAKNSNAKLPDYKVELKNINSFKFLEKAINAEIVRQESELSKGRKIIQETRGYDENKKTTFSQRVKEGSEDYRYFPEADLPPIEIGELKIKNLKLKIPELPQAKRERFQDIYKLSKDYIEILVSDLNRANYFEDVIANGMKQPRLRSLHSLHSFAMTVANLMINKHLDTDYPEPAGLARKIIELEDRSYESAENTEEAVRQVLQTNPEIIKKYQNGQTQVLSFLIGQVQKILRGSGNPKLIGDLLKSKLEK